jgi:hypothetical protein
MKPSLFGLFDDPWHHLSSYSESQRQKQTEAEVARRERSRKVQEEEERRMAEYYNNNNINNMTRPSANRQRHSKKVSRKNKSNIFAAAPSSSFVMVGEVEDDKNRIVRGLDGKYYNVGVGSIIPSSSSINVNEIMNKNKSNDVNMNSDNVTVNSAYDVGEDDHQFDVIGSQKTFRQNKTMLKKTTVVVPHFEVEDVSDEEDEELKELQSVWRNRIPSHGQWIEPVDAISW